MKSQRVQLSLSGSSTYQYASKQHCERQSQVKSKSPCSPLGSVLLSEVCKFGGEVGDSGHKGSSTNHTVMVGAILVVTVVLRMACRKFLQADLFGWWEQLQPPHLTSPCSCLWLTTCHQRIQNTVLGIRCCWADGSCLLGGGGGGGEVETAVCAVSFSYSCEQQKRSFLLEESCS